VNGEPGKEGKAGIVVEGRPWELDPDRLATVGPGDRWDVFLSFTWADADEVDLLQQALQDHGLTVFRDAHCISAFDGITDEIVAGLAGAKVLLAYYSTRYPTRHACQWELTAAFIAGQREGSPIRRVLVVNPAENSDHVQPIELEDACYFSAPRTVVERARLAARVADVVAGLDRPLGALRSLVGAPSLPSQVLRPRRFVGRYPDLWRIHGELRAGDFPATAGPRRNAAVVVTGLAGTGKSSLAEQYAFLFRDGYPGGVFWTGPLADHTDILGEERVVAEFVGQVAEIARTRLGLTVTGLPERELLSAVGRCLDLRGQPALWIVDDIPSPGTPSLVARLLIPSSWVRMVFTSRTSDPAGSLPVVDLHGLTVEEGVALFGLTRPLADQAEHLAVARLVERCGGHPMVIDNTAAALRGRPNLRSDDAAQSILDAISPSVTDSVRTGLASLDRHAHDLLVFASLLSPAPIPSGWLVPVLADEWDVNVESAQQAIGVAVAELAVRGFGQPFDRRQGAWTLRMWSVHPLATAAGHGVDRQRCLGMVNRLARIVADAVTDPVAAHGLSPSQVHQHAAHLGAEDAVPATLRSELLAATARWHEQLGAVVVATETVNQLLTVTPHRSPALLLAARIAIAAGDYEQAVTHCRDAIDRAHAVDDFRTDYRARWLAAQALDQLGRYRDAEEVFNDAVGTPCANDPPAWVPAAERSQLLIGRAVALRLRGRFDQALDLLNTVLPLLPSGSPADQVAEPSASSHMEIIRLQIITGRLTDARRAARRLVAAFHDSGLDGHPFCLDAVGLLTEAELTLDLMEMNLHEENWPKIVREATAAHAEYERTLGPDNARTLAAAYQRDFALIRQGKSQAALSTLTATESHVHRALGSDHPLRYRVTYAITLAYGQLGDVERQRVILAELLSQQERTLGTYHPDTATTQLDLGIALALLGDRHQAIAMVDEAATHIARALPLRADLRTRAEITVRFIRLPSWMWRTFRRFDKLIPH
jgi:tetratricopeptide (TPR) repeat protein